MALICAVLSSLLAAIRWMRQGVMAVVERKWCFRGRTEPFTTVPTTISLIWHPTDFTSCCETAQHTSL